MFTNGTYTGKSLWVSTVDGRFLEEVEKRETWETHHKLSTCNCCQSTLGTREAYVASDVKTGRGYTSAIIYSTIQGEKIRIIQGGKIRQRLYKEKMERGKYIAVFNLFKNSIKITYA